MLTSCLTAVKIHVIKYCEKVYERSGKNLFWSIKNSGEILDKLKARDFNATSLSTYDFSTLYTTLPHNLIKDKLIDLIERTFQREGSPYLACSDRNAFFTSEKPKKYHAWSCQNVCDALTFLLDNIFIRFKIISHYKKIGYNINVLQQTACLVVNPITVGNFAFLFNCTPVGRTSDSMMVPT